MAILKFIRRLALFFFLTILTQVGGLVYLLNFSIYPILENKIRVKWTCRFSKVLSFLILYGLISFLLVPLLAKPLGRVPLSMSGDPNLKPLTSWTCLLNRQYVRPELKEVMSSVAAQMNEAYPGTITHYLDANFPFINKFPLIPHLSHNDGKKIDLSFFYNDSKTGHSINDAPSFIGYGICEEPEAGEENTAHFCAENGYWQYSFLKAILPQGSKKDFRFNEEKTKALVTLIVNEEKIDKVFIEPHLKSRLKLTSEKVRFHGCQAVRHDDHIHIQLK